MSAAGTNHAIRGLVGFSVPILVVFSVSPFFSLTAGQTQTGYLLLAGPISGIAGGLAFGHRWRLALVLGLNFGFIAALFALQGARSALPSEIVWTGVASAVLFWIAGACATLTLPASMRFDGAKAFAIPGAIGGMLFQVLFSVFRSSGWAQLFLWLIAAGGGGWAFGQGLDRIRLKTNDYALRSTWAVISAIVGAVSLGVAAFYLPAHEFPIALAVSISPAFMASDWLWSGAIVTLVAATAGIVQTLRRSFPRGGRGWALAGAILGLALFVLSIGLTTQRWEPRFNERYADRLLLEHATADDPNHAYSVYLGNLIRAQNFLRANDTANAERHLLAAASAGFVRHIETTGPDTSVASTLLQLGRRETVLSYLRLSRNVWPRGTAAIDRWERAISINRRPNFNNRTIR
jgi:hypothetical protein